VEHKTDPEEKALDKPEEDTTADIETPRGKPKSGRSWKTPEQRCSSRIASKSVRTKWTVRKEQRQQEKEKKEILAEFQKEKDDERQKEKEKRQKRKRVREENIIKSSTYQVINDTLKIKRMSKKQKRSVMKLADLPQH